MYDRVIYFGAANAEAMVELKEQTEHCEVTNMVNELDAIKITATDKDLLVFECPKCLALAVGNNRLTIHPDVSPKKITASIMEGIDRKTKQYAFAVKDQTVVVTAVHTTLYELMLYRRNTTTAIQAYYAHLMDPNSAVVGFYDHYNLLIDHICTMQWMSEVEFACTHFNNYRKLNKCTARDVFGDLFNDALRGYCHDRIDTIGAMADKFNTEVEHILYKNKELGAIDSVKQLYHLLCFNADRILDIFNKNAK